MSEPEVQRPVLDYATPATPAVAAGEEEEEARRLRAVREYNQSTFGESDPFRIWPDIPFILVAAASASFVAKLLAALAGVVFARRWRVWDAVLQWADDCRK